MMHLQRLKEVILLICFAASAVAEKDFPISVIVNKAAPANQSDVTFTCTFDVMTQDNVLWYFGPTIANAARIAEWRGNNQNDIMYNSSYDNEVYTMSIPENGETTLAINPVRLRDEGRYWCSVVASPKTAYTHKDIIVTVAPRKTYISNGNNQYLTNEVVDMFFGRNKMFECNIFGVNPPAALSWILNNADIEPDGGQENTPVNGLYDSTIELTVNPQMQDHNKYLECKATSSPPAESVSVSTKVILNVQVSPTAANIVLSDASGDLSSYAEVVQNTQHKIFCEIKDTRPASQITWKVDNADPNDGYTITEPATMTPENGLVDSTGSLLLKRAERDHHRVNITCMASIAVLDAPSPVGKYVLLNVKGPPDHPSIDGNTNDMTENKNVSLTCIANNAYPEGEIRWFNNEKEITQGAADNTVNSQDRFNIESTIDFRPKRGDNGNTIKCNVSQDSLQYSQEVAKTVVIIVKYSPGNVIVSQDPRGPILENQTVTLICSADANPPANKFVWVKGEPEQDIGDSSTLQLVNIKRDETGPYECRAENTIPPQGVSTAFNINIYYPPENVTLMKSLEVPLTEGQDVTFTCLSEGNPLPSVYTWYKDDIAIPEVNENTLELKGVRKEQRGYYQCEADNTHFKPVKSTKNGLVIYYSPEILNSDNDKVSADEGQTAVLTCETIGHPEQKITWYAEDGNEISTDNKTTVQSVKLGSGELNGTSKNSALIISDIVPSDYGKYRCNASNDVGWNEHIISLGGSAIPDIPENVNVPSDNVTSSSLWIEWEAGYNGGITQWFLIQYHQAGSNNLEKAYNLTESEGQNSQNDYSRQIKDLTSGTLYLIYVSSGNTIGDNFNEIEPKEVVTKSAELNPTLKSNALVVGASVAGVILIIIIIALSAYLLKKPKPKKGELNHQLRQSPEKNQYATTALDSVHESTDENAAPVYAEVNKKKKATGNGNTKENAAPVYAEVNKKKKATGNGNTKEPAGNQVSGHLNESFKTEITDEEAYDDVANATSTTSDGDGRMVNPEGLIYQEVGHFKSHPKDAPPIQTEESTEYASLDFNRMVVK